MGAEVLATSPGDHAEVKAGSAADLKPEELLYWASPTQDDAVRIPHHTVTLRSAPTSAGPRHPYTRLILTLTADA